MNELMIFSNPEFGNIRTMERDGAPWFVGKDVAAALGYKDATKAARERVDTEDRGVAKMDTPLRPAGNDYHQRKWPLCACSWL